MGDQSMAIGEADLIRIGEYVRENLKEISPSGRDAWATAEQFQNGMNRIDQRFTLLTWVVGIVIAFVGAGIGLLAT